MRLLSIKTLQLEFFLSESATPPFAILSHTWGADELTLQDLALPHETLASRRGWQKITSFRDAVLTHAHLLAEPVEYIWVDTVCIDKTSSAELTEAINSMFRWYRNSVSCFAVLEDVEARDGHVGADFEASRWFTRGWTLQELLAPREVHFFDRNWVCIGSKETLASRVSSRTNIAEEIILTGEWPFATVAQRMSWASGRETTRSEDAAYCLLGIFDVNMPMLYGEGDKAFVRLQEEIIRDSEDESIFAFDASGDEVQGVGAFATHPRQFSGSAYVEALRNETGLFALTNKGLQITLAIIERQEEPGQKVGLLSCCDARDAATLIGFRVRPESPTIAKYSRLPGPPIIVPAQDRVAFRAYMRSIYLPKRVQTAMVDRRPPKVHVQGLRGGLRGLEFIRANSDSRHHSRTNSLTFQVPRTSTDGKDGVNLALLFRLAETKTTFCLILSVEPTEYLVEVGLVPGPDTLPEGTALDTMIDELAESAADVVDGEMAELMFGEEKVTVTVDPERASLLIRVILRRY